MKAAIVSKKGALAVKEIAEPVLGKFDALVHNKSCGICSSTDRKLIDGKMGWAPPFPFVLGHESCGTVVEIGSGVRHYQVGDIVTRSLAFWPGSRSDLNVAMGGFAEYGMVRDARAMAADGDDSLLEDYNCQRQLVLPPGIEPAHGSLAISLAETASMLRHLPNLRGATVAVAGVGAAGLAFLLWCKLAGARTMAIARRKQPLETAQYLAADWTVNTSQVEDVAQAIIDLADGPIDGIIEATGSAPLAQELTAALKPGGFAAAYGVPPIGEEYGAPWKEYPVEEHLAMDWVCDLIQRDFIQPEAFITHEWPLADIEQAFEQVSQGEVRKGVILM